MNTFIARQIQILLKTAQNPKFLVIVALDTVLLIGAHLAAYLIRFDGKLTDIHLQQALSALPLILLVKIPTFYITGLYRGLWRFTSLVDMQNILKAVIISSTLLVTIIVFTTRFGSLSRSVYIMDSLFTSVLVSGLRISIRYWYGLQKNQLKDGEESSVRKNRLLLLGAGEAAEKIIREVKDNPHLPYTVAGLLDDDPDKTGKQIHGARILGTMRELSYFAAQLNIDELLISIATATGNEMKWMIRLCEESGLPYKVIPGLGGIINGKVSIKSMRDISYADLLGRETVSLEQMKIGNYLTDKIVLVTGAGGSIGSELCRQLLRFSPRKIILFDAGEENLYSIQMELQHEHKYNSLVPVLGKVQDRGLLELVFQQHKPSVVFHAAAYKHVPLVEINPWQAIHNNVFAAQLLIETSIIHKVNRFVLVSTDKAVRPTNVMGASKRLTELLMLAYGRNNWDGSFSPVRQGIQSATTELGSREKIKSHHTIFMAVRFGNVLGSSGSVIPLFKRQIQMGGPVTVTHPEITRYFMSMEEAAQLILQTGAMGNGEEIFILKMGEPIKIAQMARDLIKLAGREPDTEIEIKFTGLRAGEKLYEELITEGEGIVETTHEKIMVLRGNTITCSELFQGLELLQRKTKAHDSHGIKDALQQLIPEYTPEYRTETDNKIDKAA